jgi:hypothetical protein
LGDLMEIFSVGGVLYPVISWTVVLYLNSSASGLTKVMLLQ